MHGIGFVEFITHIHMHYHAHSALLPYYVPKNAVRLVYAIISLKM